MTKVEATNDESMTNEQGPMTKRRSWSEGGAGWEAVRYNEGLNC